LFTQLDAQGASPSLLGTQPGGINNLGQIAGRFWTDSTNTFHGFLATPVSEVPEPSSLALLSVGVIGSGILRRRQRAH
jgi:hypothetical protein